MPHDDGEAHPHTFSLRTTTVAIMVATYTPAVNGLMGISPVVLPLRPHAAAELRKPTYTCALDTIWNWMLRCTAEDRKE